MPPIEAVPRFLPLSELLRTGRAPGDVVAFSRDGVRDFADFSGRVAGLCAELRRVGGTRFLLFSEDSYAFAVALLALAHSGATALLAPNRQPGTLAALAAQVDGALVDSSIAATELARLPRIAPLEVAPAAAASFGSLDPELAIAELSTSGSTGPGKAVPKALRHLDREVATLESLFGPRLGRDARVFATVSHQHLYGLLFRLLWPLAAGRAFCAETYLHSEEFFPCMRATAGFALVTTPVHLRRMRADAELASLRSQARAIFSSGGPLDESIARGIESVLGLTPIEIFGSTETGGVAWREQIAAEPDAAFHSFPHVELARASGPGVEGQLVVRSPYASLGPASAGRSDVQETLMSDRAELLGGGRFRLLGRADRIVKIGEKRLALPEMESALRAHPHVADAALVSFEPIGDARVGAVVALSDSGQAALDAQGRRALGAALGEHLAAYWDRVLLPRAWRYVAELPRDAQGKVTRAALLELLEPAAERAPVRDPVVLSEQRGASSIVRELRVPADLAFLEGHFPGQPVVAGVVQLHWVMLAAAELLGATPQLLALEGLRFRDALLPSQPFRLSLELSPARDRLRFELSDGERVFAQGRAQLAAGSGSEN
ncbi:MAG: AMP-binding protein [Deltaproteobacteria bacterium]|nr:AMP-binding protein [Deltaproteobacteria bacterium]